MVTLGFRPFNLFFALLVDFAIAGFLAFAVTMFSIMALAIIFPLTSHFVSPKVDESIWLLLIFSFAVIFCYRVLADLTEKIVLGDNSITFSNIFFKYHFQWKDIVGYSKPYYNMAQAGYGSMFGLWGPLNIWFYQTVLKWGWIPFFIQLWVKREDKVILFQKTISTYQWEPIFEVLKKEVPNPEDGKKQTRARQFFIKPKEFLVAAILALIILIGDYFIYLTLIGKYQSVAP